MSINPESSASSASSSSFSPSLFENTKIDAKSKVEKLNKALVELEESPIDTKIFKSKGKRLQKVEKVQQAISRKLLAEGNSSDKDGSKIIEQLKDKFCSVHKYSEKIQILTVLPTTWTVRRIQSVFNTTFYMARRAKQLQTVDGVLSTPNKKPGHHLSDQCVKSVQDFYRSDEVSRLMPGKKDYVSVRNCNGQREQLQKRLILSNLREAYLLFKETHTENIGFSKFADLRPRECVLAGGSGTHSVCVCVIHQNAKLMIAGLNLEVGASIPRCYKEILKSMVCNPSTYNCFLNKCGNCPRFDELSDKLKTFLEENFTDTVTCKLWTHTDRCALQEINFSSEDMYLN